MTPRQAIMVLKMAETKKIYVNAVEQFEDRVKSWTKEEKKDYLQRLTVWCNSLTKEEREGDFKVSYIKRKKRIEIIRKHL